MASVIGSPEPDAKFQADETTHVEGESRQRQHGRTKRAEDAVEHHRHQEKAGRQEIEQVALHALDGLHADVRHAGVVNPAVARVAGEHRLHVAVHRRLVVGGDRVLEEDRHGRRLAIGGDVVGHVWGWPRRARAV